MGLFKRKNRDRSKGQQIEVTATKLNGGSEQAVVGESYYQDALSGICGGKTEDGHNHACLAALVREPDNEYDEHAVAVYIDGLQVGYLPRQDARSYGPVLRKLAKSKHLGACDAQIKGGWDRGNGDEGSFGVTLFLAEPEYCDPDGPPPPPTPRSRPDTPTLTGASSSPRLDAGNVRGRHYTDWVETVKDLKRLGHNEQARDLLLELCSGVEAEGEATGLSIPPWYFEQAAIVYRKLKDPLGEVAVLERYLNNPLATNDTLEQRLEKARAKLKPT